MMRYKYFSFWAGLLVLALAIPALAGSEQNGNQPGGPGKDEPKDVQKQLDTINKNLTKLMDDWKNTNESLKFNFGEVSKDMKKLQEDLKDLKDEKMTMQVQLSKALEKIKSLEDSFTALQSEFGFLKNKMNGIKLYPPSLDKNGMSEITARLDYMEMLLKQIKASASYQAKSSPVPAGKGRIVLLNSTAEELLFIVNNKAYRVAPFSQQSLENQPAGFFSYEVISPLFGSLRKNTTSVNAGETFTISVG